METSLLRILSGLPKPAFNNPFAQIDYVFKMRGELNPSHATPRSYRSTSNIFKEYLEDISEDGDRTASFSLQEAFTWDVHFRFYRWLVAQNGRFSLETIRSHLIKLKQVIQYSRGHKYIRHDVFFVRPKLGSPTTTTDSRTAYDSELYGPICDVLENDFRSIKRHLATNVDAPLSLPGQDPRIQSPIKGDQFLRVLDLVREKGYQGVTPSQCVVTLRMSSDVTKRATEFWFERGVFERRPCINPINKVHLGWVYVYKNKPSEVMLREADPKSYGFGNLDNLVWYIFNVLEGKIPDLELAGDKPDAIPNPELDATFVNAVKQIHGGITRVKAILAERGLIYEDQKKVSARKIVTLMAMMAMITGLNVESLCSLRINCLKTEPISGKPCLQYVKKRSTGKKTLPLFEEEDRDLYSDSPEINNGNEGILFFNLLPAADRVQEIIQTTIKATETIRKKAPAELADRLFIVQRQSGGDVVALKNSELRNGWNSFFKRRLAAYLLKRATKQGLSPEALRVKEIEINNQITASTINLSKFRSSLATELALSGAPIETIQAVLGHRSRNTTKTYLERHRMELSYHLEVTKALNKIKNGGNILRCKEEEDFSKRISKGSEPEKGSGYIFETGTPLFCRNPFQPSNNIKAGIKDWVDGKSVCHHWNKCLFCDKVVIVDLALPKLIIYHNKLKLDLSCGLDITPGKTNLLEKTVAVIDKIIDPEGDFFDSETIADARIRADILSARESDELFFKVTGHRVE